MVVVVVVDVEVATTLPEESRTVDADPLTEVSELPETYQLRATI